MSDENNLDLDDLDETPVATGSTDVVDNSMDEDDDANRTANDLETVFDIPVQVSAVLGKSRMQVSQLMKIGASTVIELDRKVGEAIDIYVNNRLVARGEVVVVDERLGVTMTEIIKGNRI
jgi:flagellar motor switch protein FliN/FliY